MVAERILLQNIFLARPIDQNGHGVVREGETQLVRVKSAVEQYPIGGKKVCTPVHTERIAQPAALDMPAWVVLIVLEGVLFDFFGKVGAVAWDPHCLEIGNIRRLWN